MTSKEALAPIVEMAQKSEAVKKEIASMDKSFQFNVSDEEPYYVEINGGTVSLKDGTHASPTATISATGAVLVDMFSGNLNPIQAFMSGKLKVSGDVISAQKLTSLIDKARK